MRAMSCSSGERKIFLLFLFNNEGKGMAVFFFGLFSLSVFISKI